MAGFDGRGNFSPGTYRPGLFSSHHPADLDTVTGCGVCSCSASLDKLILSPGCAVGAFFVLLLDIIFVRSLFYACSICDFCSVNLSPGPRGNVPGLLS
jgi:hypothetical protein